MQNLLQQESGRDLLNPIEMKTVLRPPVSQVRSHSKMGTKGDP